MGITTSADVTRLNEYSISDDEGNDYSTNPDDYWSADDNAPFNDCALFQKVYISTEVDGVFMPATGWLRIKDEPTVGDLRALKGDN